MRSKISESIKLRYSPVAIVFTDERPEGALQFKEGRFGCVIAMLAGAAKGKTVVFDRKPTAVLVGERDLVLATPM
ncbi:hypothetical protein N752_23285 [Desulforamulus aquiferis]|nr:hypothetical protein N752_23285 [Desulforamulus aquiferis]